MTGKCKSCRNAFWVGITEDGLKAYICSKRTSIEEPCQHYQRGTPRDGMFEIKSVTLPEIQFGTGEVISHGR